MDKLRGCVLQACFFHAPKPDSLDHGQNALIEIDSDGRISALHRANDADYESRRDRAKRDGCLVVLPDGHYLLPGFVDLHVHAPQYPQLGLALDEPLEIWLQKYTFPLEARYAESAFAEEVYGQLVADLIANGTTTALYFATVHLKASEILADICIAKGQRALVGKVVMDDPASCPDYYRDADTQTALEETKALIDYVRSHPKNADQRVLPVITPRFIPSCTDEALEGLGALATKTGCHVQTHCSESDWEHGHVFDRYGRSDTESLKHFGLLGRRSILAHANFISDSDMDVIKTAGSGIAHCALSNIYFANAVFPLRRALEKGLHVGLGTDISGGPSASMLEATRTTVTSARMLQSGVDPELSPESRGVENSAVDLLTAFHLATAGGGQALDLPVGTFEVGQYFDAIAIDTQCVEGTIRFFDLAKTPQDRLQSILYNASKPNIASVWVSGQKLR